MHAISRQLQARIIEILGYFPAVAILGPRQCGKTTLAHEICAELDGPSTYLDLENVTDLAKLDDSVSYLSALENHLVVIDEVQNRPALFPELRGVIDAGRRRGRKHGRFLLLGSASHELLRQSGESLAGRIAYLELTPFRSDEVKPEGLDNLWLRGGFPDSYLAPSEALSREWRRNFVDTYLSRDLGQLGKVGSLPAMRNLLQMSAHLQGQVLNVTQLVQSHDFSRQQINNYLDLFEQTFIVRRLQPYFKNVGKRLTKRPKIYLRDSGLLHQLMNIVDFENLHGHPMRGPSWEGFVIEQIANLLPDWTAYFYRTSHGAEIDLLLERGDKLLAFEIKASSAPSLTKGFHLALADVKPNATYVISRTNDTWQTSDGITHSHMAELPGLLAAV